jgi:hypothetical protein
MCVGKNLFTKDILYLGNVTRTRMMEITPKKAGTGTAYRGPDQVHRAQMEIDIM